MSISHSFHPPITDINLNNPWFDHLLALLVDAVWDYITYVSIYNITACLLLGTVGRGGWGTFDIGADLTSSNFPP